MGARIFFWLVTLFFVAMNILLWRSEFMLSSPVPTEVVWRKVLTAPDSSRMAVVYDGRKIGYCTWAPNLTEPLATGRALPEQATPEGMVRRLIGYTIDLDGSIAPQPDLRLRFNLHLKLDARQAVQELVGTIKAGQDGWDIRFDAARQSVAWQQNVAGKRTAHVVQLDQPRQVERLLSEAGLPLPAGWLVALGWPGGAGPGTLSAAALGARWQSHNDWLPAGQSRLRVYRTDLSLLGQYQAKVHISPVGEVLRVTLPGGLTLHNEGLITLP